MREFIPPLPEPLTIGEDDRGSTCYTEDQMDDYARDAALLVLGAVCALLPADPVYMDPPDGGNVSVLEQVKRMAEDAAKWRANHDNLAARNALLRQRHDLPVDRIPGHAELVRLQEENARLRANQPASREWHERMAQAEIESDCNIEAGAHQPAQEQADMGDKWHSLTCDGTCNPPCKDAQEQAEKVSCPECRGTGSVMTDGDCSDCNGKGYAWEPAAQQEPVATCVCGSPATLGSVHRTDGPCYVAADPVVEANRKLLLDRSNVGIDKYGTTLEDANLAAPALVQHALEEALDLSNYLQALLRKLS